jgi:hypothetical protein
MELVGFERQLLPVVWLWRTAASLYGLGHLLAAAYCLLATGWSGRVFVAGSIKGSMTYYRWSKSAPGVNACFKQVLTMYIT